MMTSASLNSLRMATIPSSTHDRGTTMASGVAGWPDGSGDGSSEASSDGSGSARSSTSLHDHTVPSPNRISSMEESTPAPQPGPPPSIQSQSARPTGPA